jgi:hypothetical protein
MWNKCGGRGRDIDHPPVFLGRDNVLKKGARRSAYQYGIAG